MKFETRNTYTGLSIWSIYEEEPEEAMLNYFIPDASVPLVIFSGWLEYSGFIDEVEIWSDPIEHYEIDLMEEYVFSGNWWCYSITDWFEDILISRMGDDYLYSPTTGIIETDYDIPFSGDLTAVDSYLWGTGSTEISGVNHITLQQYDLSSEQYIQTEVTDAVIDHDYSKTVIGACEDNLYVSRYDMLYVFDLASLDLIESMIIPYVDPIGLNYYDNTLFFQSSFNRMIYQMNPYNGQICKSYKGDCPVHYNPMGVTSLQGRLWSAYGITNSYSEGDLTLYSCDLAQYTQEEDEILENGEDIKIVNYPNPFNPETTISFSLSAKEVKTAKLKIYNIKGQKIKYLPVSISPDLSLYKITWDGTDENGIPVPSGIYLCTLKNGKTSNTHKMLLLK